LHFDPKAYHWLYWLIIVVLVALRFWGKIPMNLWWLHPHCALLYHALSMKNTFELGVDCQLQCTMHGINHGKNEKQFTCLSVCGPFDAAADAVITV